MGGFTKSLEHGYIGLKREKLLLLSRILQDGTQIFQGNSLLSSFGARRKISEEAIRIWVVELWSVDDGLKILQLEILNSYFGSPMKVRLPEFSEVEVGGRMIIF
ncbi:hypothetical protein HAX54_038865 [Datura stramonium]|uniref:Uncharacterized protein n=1 Tax=Datura stramonium TaxID=4076 RepID=A0ABS8SIR8_DATST|nr:hypothetical protein [Datura stramonium]